MHFWGSQSWQQRPTRQADLRRAIWVTRVFDGEKQRTSPGAAAASAGPGLFRHQADAVRTTEASVSWGSHSLVSPASLSHSSSPQTIQKSVSSLRVQVGRSPGGQLSPSPWSLWGIVLSQWRLKGQTDTHRRG